MPAQRSSSSRLVSILAAVNEIPSELRDAQAPVLDGPYVHRFRKPRVRKAPHGAAARCRGWRELGDKLVCPLRPDPGDFDSWAKVGGAEWG